VLKFINCSVKHYFVQQCIRSCIFSVTWSNDRRPRWRTEVCVVDLLPIKFSFISVMISYQNVPLNQPMWVFFKEYFVTTCKKGKVKPRQFSIGSERSSTPRAPESIQLQASLLTPKTWSHYTNNSNSPFMQVVYPSCHLLNQLKYTIYSSTQCWILTIGYMADDK